VKTSAILVLGSPAPAYSFLAREDRQASGCPGDIAGIPLSCIEILGASILQRTMQRFADAGVDSFTILADASLLKVIKLANVMPGWMVKINSFQNEGDVWPAIERSLQSDFTNQTKDVFLVKLGAYVEFDPNAVLQFAENNDHGSVRVNDQLGSVGTWLLNHSANLESVGKEFQNRGQDSSIKTYFFDGYVNRLSRMQDLRRFVTDVFQSQCSALPQGKEVRAGIWVDDGAQVHKQARIVPPAYIGKNSRIGPASLITRSSSIERDCNVDYGTVIEDSSVLASTYIGTGLDVAHSVVCGNMLVHLNQDLVMEINDQILIGTNVVSRLRDVFRRQEKKVLSIRSVKKDEHQTHLKGIL
jgi:NDP-sugar pyrophosphorylase family protein